MYSIGAVVLAAGAGRRFGGPKALARIGAIGLAGVGAKMRAGTDPGRRPPADMQALTPVDTQALVQVGAKTWLDIAVVRICKAGVRWISIVLGAHAEEVKAGSSVMAVSQACGCSDVTISWVLNHDWKQGRTGSIARGISDLPSWSRGALIYPVDFPFVQARTPRLLAEAFERATGAEGMLFLPVEGGRRGHPILVGRGVWPEITVMAPDEPLHKVVRREVGRMCEVAVGDPGIHKDINTAADIDRGGR